MSDDDTKHDDPTLPWVTLLSWLEEWGWEVEPHKVAGPRTARVRKDSFDFRANQRVPHIAVATTVDSDWGDWADTSGEGAELGDALFAIAANGGKMAQDPKLRGVVALLLSRAIRVAFPEASDVLASVYAIAAAELRAKPFPEPEPADVVGGPIRVEDHGAEGEDDAHYDRRGAFARAVRDWGGLTSEQLRERCRCGHELWHHVQDGKLTDCKHHDGTYRCPCARFRPMPRE